MAHPERRQPRDSLLPFQCLQLEYGSAPNKVASRVMVRYAGCSPKAWPRSTSRCAHPHAGFAVLAFLDTEFTDLVIRPRLLSVGVVAERGISSEFYAEVTDQDRIHATGWFGQSAVLPHFGKIAGAACSYAELGERLSLFFGELMKGLRVDEFIELAFGYHLDWELVDLAIKDSGTHGWESVRRRIRPVNVYEITGFDAGKLATEAYFKAQASAPICRHHALCDARALRVSYEAAKRVPVEPGQSNLLLDGHKHRTIAA